MISIALCFIFATAIACGVLIVIKLNGNPNKLTLRGKRYVFVISLIAGSLVFQAAIHFNVNCDLRNNHKQQCHVSWL